MNLKTISRLDHSVKFCLRTTVSAILKKVETGGFLSKLYEIFAILCEKACTSPQLTFLTNFIGNMCTVTCIPHVPYKNDDLFLHPLLIKLSLVLMGNYNTQRT